MTNKLVIIIYFKFLISLSLLIFIRYANDGFKVSSTFKIYDRFNFELLF